MLNESLVQYDKVIARRLRVEEGEDFQTMYCTATLIITPSTGSKPMRDSPEIIQYASEEFINNGGCVLETLSTNYDSALYLVGQHNKEKSGWKKAEYVTQYDNIWV